jgi:hypothetical protein
MAAPLTPGAIVPLATVKLKEPAIRTRGTLADPVTDIYAASVPAPSPQSPPSVFPWKLAAGALIAMAILIVGGRMLLTRGSTVVDRVPDDAAAPAATAAASAPVSAAAEPTGNTGRLEIGTQPAGARILLDGKPAGESPLALDAVPAGRHTITFVSASGSVKRNVRVEAGRTVTVDVPIFSGWLGIYAPFVLEVSEQGRVIGTTEEPRLLLSPGRHELVLSNRELGYTSVHAVDIEPGELAAITLEPRGFVNLNATPWAEVWIDGRKAGDTPLARVELPLGVREIAFRHPQFGERKVTVTVKAGAPSAVSVDMTQP